MGLKERITKLVARVLRLKPVRVFMQYNSQRGPILASGLAYQAIFAVFAGLWVAFSINLLAPHKKCTCEADNDERKGKDKSAPEMYVQQDLTHVF